MPHPEMKQIISLLEKGKDFSLDQYQYRKMTGIDIPKSKYYTENFLGEISKLTEQKNMDIH